jgi:FtsP/CotA-like multicopper oxidase with cupredoxin domain
MPAPERTRRFVMAHAMGGMGSHGMGMGFQINGVSFDPNRIDTRVQLGSTEDWVIVNNDVMDHPFHLHVNPFQVVNSSGQLPAERAWKDTILVKAGQETKIRVTFQDFAGRTVYHCHNLDHEDLGLMGVLQIDGTPS